MSGLNVPNPSIKIGFLATSNLSFHVAISVFNFASVACLNTLLSPNTYTKVIPARINKTTIVTTRATSVMPSVIYFLH